MCAMGSVLAEEDSQVPKLIVAQRLSPRRVESATTVRRQALYFSKGLSHFVGILPHMDGVEEWQNIISRHVLQVVCAPYHDADAEPVEVSVHLWPRLREVLTTQDDDPSLARTFNVREALVKCFVQSKLVGEHDIGDVHVGLDGQAVSPIHKGGALYHRVLHVRNESLALQGVVRAGMRQEGDALVSRHLHLLSDLVTSPEVAEG